MLVSKVESASSAHEAFFKILDDVTQDSSIVIVEREDEPNVALIAESELNSLVETVHLLRSPKNAERLFSALEKSKTRDLDSLEAEDTNPSKELEDLRRYCEQTEEENTVEVIIGNESEEISNL